MAFFKNSSFLVGGSFIGATFRKAADFTKTLSSPVAQRMDFSRAVFGPYESSRHSEMISFRNRIFSHDLIFDDALFYCPPNLNGAEYGEGISFKNARFASIAPNDYLHYRNLAEKMKTIGAWLEHQAFFEAEQESLRVDKNTPFSIRTVALFYKRFSSYGASFSRPLILFALLQIFAFCLYFNANRFVDCCANELACYVCGLEWPQTIMFTLKQAILPFDILKEQIIKTPSGAIKIIEYPYQLRAIAIVHSVLSYFLFALFFFAIRRRFRLQ
ncbi:MAG: hypothetical protein HZA03_06050 [Nitrospinae bacterium]|nr:hypothetical protein [Nitrospinota bacterium]